MWFSRYWFWANLFLALLGLAFESAALVGIAVFLLAAGLLARFWARHIFDGLRYERVMPENRAFAGEKLQFTARLVNDKLLPVPWIEVRDPVPEGVLKDLAQAPPHAYPGYVYLARSTHLSWYERVNWKMELEAPARGFYRLGPVRLASGDIFGFFPVSKEETDADSMIVYPKVYTLPELGLPADRPFGEIKGRERIFEDPSRIAGLRDYRPGDPMRRIDWKASARLQALQSKVYEPSSTLQLLVALNVHTLDHSWEGYVPDLLERLLSVAGSVAQYGLDAGYAVGLVANGAYPESDRPMRVPAGRSSDQLMKVLEALAVIGPLTLSPLQHVLEREAQSFPFGATLVCVTARMDAGMAATLRRIAGAGHAVTLLSLADHDISQDLGRIRVYELAEAMRALESRASREETPEAASS